jgi:hypothetical protein
MTYQPGRPANLRRPGYPDDISIVFDSAIRDTGLALFPLPARAARFRVFALTDTGARQLDFVFRDLDNNGFLSRLDEYIDALTGTPPGTQFDVTWRAVIDTTGQGGAPIVPPTLGDTYLMQLDLPLTEADVFEFRTTAQRVDGALAAAEWAEKPYVVPNPYVGAASFEPERFGVSGRGERRIEFRALPQGSVIRIYSVRGELVQTLQHDGSNDGTVPWNLRTKDNLDVAPGLFIFHVDAPGVGEHIGKFAIVK